ncbi:Cytochrome p450, partial [Thalictrum thalictroides]
NSHQIVPRVLPYYHQVVQQYGKMSYFWFGPMPWLIVMDPDMIKEILSDNSGSFRKAKTNPYGKLLITGLVTYEGDKWAKHRKIINPAFHQDKLKMMLPAFDTSCCEMINKWLNLTSEGYCELDVWPDLQNLTTDVISRTGFGSSYEEGRQIFRLQGEQAALVAQAGQSIYIPGLRFLPTKTNNRMKEIHREVQALLRDMILKREKAMKFGEATTNDILGILMESNFKEIKEGGNSKVGMTINDVIEECKLFYFAGQETTATLLAWAMVVLSMHQEWQQKAREEVMQVFGSNKPEYDGLNRLKVITMILNEVLRLYPPATIMMRETYKKIKLGDVILPPGVHLVLLTLLMHHDPELWGEDADEFNPERFSEGISKVTRNKVSFYPFSWGPRFCIGQNFAILESKMALALILQHFSFELSTTYVHAPYTVITLQPQHGVQLVLHKI